MRIAQLCLRHVPSPLEKAAPFPLLASPCSRIHDMLDCSPAEAPIFVDPPSHADQRVHALSTNAMMSAALAACKNALSHANQLQLLCQAMLFTLHRQHPAVLYHM